MTSTLLCDLKNCLLKQIMQEFENIEQLVQSMTANDEKYIVNFLKNRLQFLSLPMADGTDPLAILDPTTIFYCMILSQRLVVDCPEQLLNYAYIFATTFKRPITLEGFKEFERLASALYQIAETGKYGGKVTATAIALVTQLAMHESKHFLTPLHSIALMIVLEVPLY